MHSKFNRALCASTALVTGLLVATTAFAQSTAGQVQELIVTGSRAAKSTAGLATVVNEAKDQSIIGKEFISTQLPSSNIGQLINMLPGVSYSTEDPGGFNSGDLRIHGFDGAHVAFILDGAPLNDTGNYAVYPGEYMIGELIDHITVNIGSSDVDSPSASALGATINVVTRVPPDKFGGQANVSGGSYNYKRLFGELDTGDIGPTGLKAYIAGEYGKEDNFKDRPGYSRRWDISGRVYQPLAGSDFLSLSGIYSNEKQYPAFRVSPALIASAGRYYLGDNYTWAPETITAGVADTVPQGVGPSGADTNYYGLFPNPVKFASIRGQSHFTLADNLVLTVDPNLFYTIANGGGSASVSEKDPRLIGNTKLAGVDLNGDGDILDTVVAYAPSNTTTHRYGLTSSLLWDLNKENHFQLAYTLDYGRHRQTGEETYVNPMTGSPDNLFGGRPGYGRPIFTADGNILRTRDRFSIAILNQVSANYIGKFMDDKLHVNVGIRAPFFERKINQNCYTYNGTSSYCDAVDPNAVLAAYNADLAAHGAQGATATNLAAVFSKGISPVFGPNGIPNFRMPFSQTVKYDKVLPNAGISYRIADDHMIYASYASGFTAPKTDNLYTSSPDLVHPETSDNYAAGYRYQTTKLNASVNVYDTEYKNRIVTSPDPTDPTLSIDRNVGSVRVYGLDLEAGLTPLEHLHVYGSANFNKSEVLANLTLATGGVAFSLPIKGKELVLTPDKMFAARVSYDVTDALTFGVQAKYTGKRFISDLNDASIDSYTTVNLDGRWTMPFLDGNSYVQFNVLNVFDKFYISRSTTFNNGVNYAIPGTTKIYTATTPAYYVGAPRTFSVTLGAKF